MYKNREILALIPARGGSKGVPRKNLRLLGGKPLIAYSIETARSCPLIDRVIVSTDDQEIAQVARKYSAQVPFIRPRELAQDDTPDLPVCVHALKWLHDKESYDPEILIFFRPTGPLRTLEQITEGIKLLLSHPAAESVRSVNEPPQTPYKMWRPGHPFMKPILHYKKIREPYNSLRQILPKVYQTNPYVHVVWTKTVLKKRSMTGKRVLALPIEGPVVDIDSEFDLIVAEVLRKYYRVAFKE